jgi:hypothetical protein
MERIRARQWASSPDGHVLTRALVEMMQGYFPKLLGGVPDALIRQLAGDGCADLLGLKPRDWTVALVEAGERLEGLLDPELHGSRLFARATHRLMEGIVLVQREGKQAQFRIPPSLRRAIQPV